eukprot:scaffold2441_cov413-Prasinococcus_capsulatus_cf.AAC.6
MLMQGAGKDATKLFDKYHRWVNYEFLLEKFLIGDYQKLGPHACPLSAISSLYNCRAPEVTDRRLSVSPPDVGGVTKPVCLAAHDCLVADRRLLTSASVTTERWQSTWIPSQHAREVGARCLGPHSCPHQPHQPPRAGLEDGGPERPYRYKRGVRPGFREQKRAALGAKAKERARRASCSARRGRVRPRPQLAVTAPPGQPSWEPSLVACCCGVCRAAACWRLRSSSWPVCR